MTSQCKACGARNTAPGRTLCRKCAKNTLAALDIIEVYDEPMRDIIDRRATRTSGSTVHVQANEPPEPIRLALAERYERWRRLLLDDAAAVGDVPDHVPTLAALAQALRVGRALNSGIAGDVARHVQDIAATMERVCDPPRARIALGLCPQCGGRVWAREGDKAGECAACHAVVSASDVASELAARLATDTRRGYPSDVSRMLARGGVRCPAATIRTWVRRGVVEADATGMVSVADVAAVLVRSRRSSTVKR